MSRPRDLRSWLSARLVFGLFVLALGLVFTVDSLGLAEARPLLRWWPLLLVGLGLVKLAEPDRPASLVFGGLLVLFGGALVLDNLDLIDFDWGVAFPLALVLVGGAIVWQALGRRRSGAAAGPAGDTVSGFALLSGATRRSTSSAFRGGDVSAILGACEVDLRQASLAEGGAVLDVFALWGGVEIRVPADWRVEVAGTPILGAFEDQTRSEAARADRKLVIQGMVLMGGVEVKN
jgi:hypothetical protein